MSEAPIDTESPKPHIVRYVHFVQDERPMSRIPTSKARHELASLINRVAYGGERIILQRRGRDVAAFVSVDELALLEHRDVMTFEFEPSD